MLFTADDEPGVTPPGNGGAGDAAAVAVLPQHLIRPAYAPTETHISQPLDAKYAGSVEQSCGVCMNIVYMQPFNKF